MAKGRKPVPASIHKLKGTYRPDRHGGEPEVESVLPDPPDYLDDVAQAEWRRIAPELHKAGILSKLDIVVLEMYCSIYSRWRYAEKKIHTRKTHAKAVTTAENGYMMQSTWLTVSSRCVKQLKDLSTEFGLTPVSRARMKMKKEDERPQDLLELLNDLSKAKASNG